MSRGPSALLAALFTVLVLAGCGGGSEAPTDSPSAEPAPTDEQLVQDLVADFWAARVATQNPGTKDPGAFDGVATPKQTEVEMARLGEQEEYGATRTGEPVVTEVEPRLDGDAPYAVMCLNEDDWRFQSSTDVVRIEPRGTIAFGIELVREGDTWLVDGTIDTDDERVRAKTC